MTELQPCAMLANGPPCTSAGEPSSVCTRLGATASFSSTDIAPSAFRSAAVMFVPSRVCADDHLAQPRLQVGQVCATGRTPP